MEIYTHSGVHVVFGMIYLTAKIATRTIRKERARFLDGERFTIPIVAISATRARSRGDGRMESGAKAVAYAGFSLAIR